MSYALLHVIYIVLPERHDWDSWVLSICDVIHVVVALLFPPLYVSRPSSEEVEQHTLHEDSDMAIDDIAYIAVEVGACRDAWEALVTVDGDDAEDATSSEAVCHSYSIQEGLEEEMDDNMELHPDAAEVPTHWRQPGL